MPSSRSAGGHCSPEDSGVLGAERLGLAACANSTAHRLSAIAREMSTEAKTLRRRGLRLEYLTIGWNLIEAALRSQPDYRRARFALVGFGFDSMIEVVSASVVVCQLRDEISGGVDEERERRALKLIAVTFFTLSGIRRGRGRAGLFRW